MEKAETTYLNEEQVFTVTVNEGEDVELKCTLYRKNLFKSVVYYAIGLISCSLSFLIFYWYPVQRVLATHDECLVKDAEIVIVKDHEKQRYAYKIHRIRQQQSTIRELNISNGHSLSTTNETEYVYFTHQYLRYFWNSSVKTFSEPAGYTICSRNLSSGVSNEDRQRILHIYGSNVIDIPTKSFFRIFFELGSDPFYAFQLFSCILWIIQEYISYSVFIITVSFLGLLISTYTTRKRLQMIKSMISECRQVPVVRGYFTDHSIPDVYMIDSQDLVPGDIILMGNSYQMMCDAYLLSGHCVVDESLLTGESIPVQKVEVPGMEFRECNLRTLNDLTAKMQLKSHMLFNGTTVLQASPVDGKPNAYAVVSSTGFYTLKGRLLKTILHSSPLHFKFFRDSYKFILVIAFLGFCGFCYTVYILNEHGYTVSEIAVKALDIFTIAISPALPIALTTGIILAARKLRQNNIFCTDLPRITSSAKTNLICLDKTGTLTDNYLSVSCIHPSIDGEFMESSVNTHFARNEDFIRNLASCHGLTSINGNVVGDPLDIALLDFVCWSIDNQGKKTCLDLPVITTVINNENPHSLVLNELHIIKRFVFDPQLKRISVLVADKTDVMAYVKGAPENIITLCDPNTIPVQFYRCLEAYTKAGNRVIALAGKKIGKISNFSQEKLNILCREDTETRLQFHGFVVLKNPLKSSTTAVIDELQNASLKTVMVTGDNVQTAVSVGFQCHLLSTNSKVVEVKVVNSKLAYETMDYFITEEVHTETRNKSKVECKPKPLQLTSDDYGHASTSEPILERQYVLSGEEIEKIKKYFPRSYNDILICCKIFGRMTPDQKAAIVNDYKSLGYSVCMCGDGANDCHALKEADVGISLSEAEASIAAPFTSKVQDITCIPRLISEGRAALVTSFSCFKFVALYSLVQFISVLVLFWSSSTLNDNQYLLFDSFVALGLVAVMVEARSNPELSNERPLGRLFHPTIIASICCQVVIQATFQLIAFNYVKNMGWYQPPPSFKVDDHVLYVKCQENTAIFAASSFQYVILAVAFGEGKPFRQSNILKTRFTSYTAALTVLLFFLVIHPGRHLQEFFMLVEIPDYTFSVSLILLSVGNAFISIVGEKYILHSSTVKSMLNKLRRK